MSVLAPKHDTLISMARLVYEKSELNFLNVSFSIDDEDERDKKIIVYIHDDEKNTKELYEKITVSELVASYIGLDLITDLDANDAVTTGHRLGKNYR